MLSNYSLPTASFKTSEWTNKKKRKHPNPVWCGLWSAQSHEKFMYRKKTKRTQKKRKLNLWTEIQNPQTPKLQNLHRTTTNTDQSIILNWILMFLLLLLLLLWKSNENNLSNIQFYRLSEKAPFLCWLCSSVFDSEF